MKYRREIDGLRALAVVPVMLFHAGFEAFSGGFVGVDVFFVISGYLITTIILSNLAHGQFSLVHFYERRARRILPALFFVMLVCIPLSWILFSPSELVNFSKSLVAVPLFLSNFFFMADGDYFETAAELKPLLHTWSLAVEEQYYLIFPLFLLFTQKLSRRAVVLWLTFIFLLSLSLAQWASVNHPAFAFFLLPTRAWELLLGAFAAFYLIDKDQAKENNIKHELCAWLGVILLLASIFNYSKITPFPGWYTLLPTCGSLLIIVFANQKTTVSAFLGNKFFVSIGLISYSAYLWHQPILAFARHTEFDLDSTGKLVLLAFTFFLSTLTWKFIELPCRHGIGTFWRSRQRVLAALAMIGLIFVIFGHLSERNDFQQEEIMAKTLSKNPAIFSATINERKFIKSRVHHENGNPNMLILGSSRIMQIGSDMANTDVLNFSVSGASVDDNIAIWHLASQKFNPKYVLIGADPWLFNANSGQDRWKTLDLEFQAGSKNLTPNASATGNTANSPVFEENRLSTLYKAINIRRIAAQDDTPAVIDKVRRDGSRVYNIFYANKSTIEVEREAKQFLDYAMKNYARSEKLQKLFEMLVSSIAASREVVVVLSPYHPALYDLMKSQNSEFLEIENLFKTIAKRLNVRWIGSYDPAQVGCTEAEFFDGMHPKDACMAKVFASMHK